MSRMAFAAILAASLVSAAAAGSFDIAVRGRSPDCAIVREADAPPAVVYAAEELRDFTERMTGVRLPIVAVADATSASLPAKAIVLELAGRPDGKSFCQSDGFRLKAEDGKLRVIGSGARGVLNGVYELLERYGGCRWYASWHTVVPKREAFSVPDTLDDAQTPAFLCRDNHWRDYFDGDFAARNRVNGGMNGQQERHGGNVWRFGGGLGNCHTFDTLLPPAKYFDAHPEYYSLVGGKRRKEKTQLCLTNPDVLRIVTSNVLARIRKDPGAKFYGVSQNDWRNYCECPACKAVDNEEGTHAGTMVRFVNAVAEAVEKEFPDKIIETLAYQYTRHAPAKTKLRHNVIPCLCSIECDFSRSFAKSRYPENARFLKDLADWNRQTDFLYVWDYVTDFCCYLHPFPDVYAAQENLKLFRDHGVKMMFEQGDNDGRHAAFAELKGWLFAKWMWNPDLPAETLLSDFFNGYYGKAAPFVRAVFDESHRRMEEYIAADPARAMKINMEVTTLDCREALDDAFVIWAQEQMKKGLAAVAAEDSVYSYNVRMTAFAFDFIRLERLQGGAMIDFSGGRRCDVPGDDAEARTLAQSLLARLDEAKNIRLYGMPGRDESTILRWKTLLRPAPVTRRAPAPFGTIPESAFILRERSCSEVREDPQAEDGKAAYISSIHSGWCANYYFDNMKFHPGRTYALKARVRVERKPDVSGNAFWAGVYNNEARKSRGKITVKTDALQGDGYAWYAIAEWKPERGDYFWIGVGPFDKKDGAAVGGVWVDEIRIEEKK